MLSESKVRELAIRWYFLALKAQHENSKSAPQLFSKAHAFIHVLDLPADIQCGKKSQDGLKTYCKALLAQWGTAPDDNIVAWLNSNVKLDFESHI